MSRFPRITETFVLYEILELRKLGIEVEIYPLIRESGSAEHPEVAEVMDSVRFHPFLSFPIVLAILHTFLHRPWTFLKVVARSLASTSGSLNLLFGALGILPKSVRFAYEMERRGITHVHAHFATHPALSAWIVHQLTSIPFSFTAHGSDIHVDQRGVDQKILASEFTVMVSEYNRDFLVGKFGPGISGKMRVVRCGMDPEAFTPAPRSDSVAPVGRPLEILCVASFREVKGHRYLLDACAMLRRRGIPFRCHLVGDGPLRARIRRQLAETGLEDVVVLHGSLPRPGVARAMRDADVVALTSIQDRQGRREGVPVTLMEAMACGLPVVSTLQSGIPELVESGRTGFLTEPGDSQGIADALEKLAGSPELRLRMGEEGRKRVLERFDLRKNTVALAELFIASSASRAPQRAGEPERRQLA
jgi:glycosyltransferase involved in cell wall biosynthesis